jgi:hypothetical protein
MVDNVEVEAVFRPSQTERDVCFLDKQVEGVGWLSVR